MYDRKDLFEWVASGKIAIQIIILVVAIGIASYGIAATGYLYVTGVSIIQGDYVIVQYIVWVTSILYIAGAIGDNGGK